MNSVSRSVCLGQALSPDKLCSAKSSEEICLDTGDMSAREQWGLHGNQSPGKGSLGNWLLIPPWGLGPAQAALLSAPQQVK